jgi:vanillate/3-O-methylgallate O-demethylase
MASLDDEIRAAGGPLQLLRSGRSGAYAFPVKSEYTNWRDEMESWRTTASLMDLSLHMPDLTVKGPDTYRLLSDIGANSFKGFGPMKAKQLIAVGHDGYMVGDAILFCLAENHVRIVGRPPALNWVQFHAETGGYDVEVSKDERLVVNPAGKREFYRLQLQGPTANEIFEKVNGGPMPEIKFFHMGTFKIGTYTTTALNHRMSGFPGLEFFGPYEDYQGDRVRMDREHAPGRLLEPRDAALPGVGERQVVRGKPRSCRLVRLRPHRGLLRDAVGHRLHPHHEVRP